MFRAEIPGKFTPERMILAEQIKRSRGFDRTLEGSYRNDAGATQYIYDLNGLEEFFNHIRESEHGNRVLDIGAGTGRAASELAQRDIGRDLEFFGTTLLRKKSVTEKGLDQDHNKVTSSERLKGFGNDSFTGILSRSGLAYSKSASLAVHSIDRVLVPGGVLKADFDNINGNNAVGIPYGFRSSYEEFAQEFLNLGYDIAIENWRGIVLLAIKPGGGSSKNALELLESDEAVKGLRDYRKELGRVTAMHLNDLSLMSD